MTRTAFLSLEAELEIIADKYDVWADDDQRAATHSGSVEMRNYWQGRCDTWREAAKHIRKAVEDSRPQEVSFEIEPRPADNHPSVT